MPGHCAQQLRLVPALEDWGSMWWHHIWWCYSRWHDSWSHHRVVLKRKMVVVVVLELEHMKNTKEKVYHCYSSCETFVQFDVSFWDLHLYLWKNYKVGLYIKKSVWGLDPLFHLPGYSPVALPLVCVLKQSLSYNLYVLYIYIYIWIIWQLSVFKISKSWLCYGMQLDATGCNWMGLSVCQVILAMVLPTVGRSDPAVILRVIVQLSAVRPGTLQAGDIRPALAKCQAIKNLRIFLIFKLIFGESIAMPTIVSFQWKMTNIRKRYSCRTLLLLYMYSFIYWDIKMWMW